MVPIQIISHRVARYNNLLRIARLGKLDEIRINYVNHKLQNIVPNSLRAIKKHAEGSGHICDGCEEEIPMDRREVVVGAIRCLECQSVWEKKNVQ